MVGRCLAGWAVVPQTDGVTESGIGLLQASLGTTVEHYAGNDVSLEASSVCVADGSGKIVREGKVASEPAAPIAWFAGLELARIGLEAGPAMVGAVGLEPTTR